MFLLFCLYHSDLFYLYIFLIQIALSIKAQVLDMPSVVLTQVIHMYVISYLLLIAEQLFLVHICQGEALT